ncbi:SGNH/GDSL hydrolase family protein [Thalassococcus sp. CAU 1522]|uniref:SGNH/GDSL hydrolase family protein n=1 Tax=Thalassococcus arenae TaxID=2851652 RepID=A0ABS6N6H4_9RHOB|nr:SGNH/GDSL hydrolase family protein [Thalassococcus arenae]MBV2359606.1 SGNH/GDSL hydrolase family protein [Thalassococcus arenae]
MFRRLISLALALCLLVPSPVAAEVPRVLLIGDSLLASHKVSGRSVAHYLERYLEAPVRNRSVLGARMIYKLPVTGALGLSIPAQFRTDEDWDIVIVNGGGNDLWMGCACRRCDRKMNRLISESGTRGEVPKLLARIHKTGARIIYVGYLRSPGIVTPIEACKDEGDAFEARIATLAGKVQGIDYLSLQDLVPHGDASWLALDGVHPATKTSREIARRLADMIKPVD